MDISPKITKTGGTTFPIGKTTVVNYTAMDKAGNTATCSVRVTVKKQGNKPAMSCVLLDLTGFFGLPLSLLGFKSTLISVVGHRSL